MTIDRRTSRSCAGCSLAARSALAVAVAGRWPRPSSLAPAAEPQAATAAGCTARRPADRDRRSSSASTAATDKALDYLESKQIKQGDDGRLVEHATRPSTPWRMLAFLGRGHVARPRQVRRRGRGRRRQAGVLTRARSTCCRRRSRPATSRPARMYEHGLATLALAEMYGMDPDPDLEEKLRKAVDLIVKRQSPAGGWRYSPAPVDQDLSVTRHADRGPAGGQQRRDPGARRRRSRRRSSTCSRAATPGRRLRLRRRRHRARRRAPAGILSLQLLGQVRRPARSPRRSTYLPTRPGRLGRPAARSTSTTSTTTPSRRIYQAGGKHWNDWHPTVRELLLAEAERGRQLGRAAGHGRGRARRPPNKIYSTAMAHAGPEHLHALSAGVSALRHRRERDHGRSPRRCDGPIAPRLRCPGVRPSPARRRDRARSPGTRRRAGAASPAVTAPSTATSTTRQYPGQGRREDGQVHDRRAAARRDLRRDHRRRRRAGWKAST